ncbi:hypothetical protein JCM3774_001049 [Rhodotorula dairenensis]
MAVDHAFSPALSFGSGDGGDCARPLLLDFSTATGSCQPSSPSATANGHGATGSVQSELVSVLTRLKQYWASVRRSRAGKRALIVVAVSCAVFLLHRGTGKDKGFKSSREGVACDVDLVDWRDVYAPQNPQVARVSPGIKETFLEHLDAHFPLADEHTAPPPHIWLTLAETRYVRTGVANLDLFVRQLNSERSARFSRHPRPETRLVVLCLDDECLRECGQRRIYAYGGYERVRPPQVRRATWPKVGAFIDVLPHRDLFFVDADVSFRADPYPYLEPLVEKFDILAQENDALEHFNTGWLWMRRGDAVAGAWRAVLAADLHVESRDQVFFNEVLGTRESRLRGGSFERLRDHFVARNGLRVKILDPSLFRVYHLEGRTDLSRHDSLFLHTTCANDIEMKLFVPKVEGYWQDVDEYYTRPRQLISIDQLAGTRHDLAQALRVLLTLGFYTSRTLVPPAHVTFLDLASDVPVRKSYAAFPLSHLATTEHPRNPYNVSVVEPDFVAHATSALLGRSVLEAGEARVDRWWQDLGQEEQERRQGRALALTRIVEVDMRPHATLSSLIRHLTTEPTLVAADHVRLIHHDWTGHQYWRTWILPGTVQNLDLCDRLDELPTCDQICRFRDGQHGLATAQPWPPLEELM